MHDRRAQPGREADRGRVEGVIVDNLVPSLTDGGVDGGESCLGRHQPFSGRTRGSVERGGKRIGIDRCVDHPHARQLGSGGGVKMNLVAPAHQAAREIGYERL
jgi:hypothetical protein